MKNLLLIGVALVALTSVAQAAVEIPEEFHGTWCTSQKNAKDTNFPFGNQPQVFGEKFENLGWSCDRFGPDSFEIEVTARGFKGFSGELNCAVTKAQSFATSNFAKWGPAYRVKFKCHQEADTSFTTKTWTWQNIKAYIVMEVAK